MSRLSYLASLTPLELWRIARHRLPGFRGGASWTPSELLSSAKHTRGIRFAELLLRQEVIARRALDGWPPIAFEGKRVVEVGCGPLAGFGPLAIFCGAALFQSAEPEWDPALFSSEQVRRKYLRTFHADLTAVYGARMTFEQFCGELDRRIVVATSGFEWAPIDGPVDVVLSQSVLEHVFPLEDTVRKLASIQGPQTRFMHLVDFGNHYPTENPFEGLYDVPPETYIARRGRAINCLRASEVTALFDRHGIAMKLVPSRVMPVPVHVHEFWRGRFSDADLATQLALIVSER